MKEVITSRILRPIPLLIAVCFLSISAQAQYGGGSGTTASAETNTYVFLPDQSTVVQTGGIASVHWTYSVEGQFQLTVDPDAGTASFTHVDANATDDSPSRRTLDPNDVFNMTSLLGAVIDDTTISFTGKADDGSDVLITVTIEDELAYLVGENIPPPNTADFFLFSLDAAGQRKYGGGTGEPNDPYLIYTAEQMNAIGAEPNDYDKHFILTANIDLSTYKGTDFNIIGYLTNYGVIRKPFTGVFDGNDHTISNFSYTSTDRDSAGLFGYIWDAEIKDLGLIDPNVDAEIADYVGVLVGYMSRGTIRNCYVQGGIVLGGDYVGGLVGGNGLSRDGWGASYIGGTITNCCSTGKVSGNSPVGGLAGINGGTITNSFSTVSVLGTGGSTGGLVGVNACSTLRECLFGTISNCYSMGNVNGGLSVGGLVGNNIWSSGSDRVVSYDSGTIINCYSTGRVSGDYGVGGLVGQNSSFGGTGNITNSFWDIETSGQNDMCGDPWSPGRATGCDDSYGKTTAEMQMASTFIGWWCGLVWTIDEGRDYPRLWWQNMTGEAITTPYYGGGCGTAEEPYLIYTAEHMNAIGAHAEDWDKHFKLMDDIDLSRYTEPDYNIIGYKVGFVEKSFTGVFDGNRHTISNFTCTSTDTDFVGLFGFVNDPNAEIKDLGLIDPNVDPGTGYYVGSLVGYLSNGTITNCYVEGGSVAGGVVGGLVGMNGGFQSTGTITNCYATVRVSGNNDVGGLVGNNNRGTITGCFWDTQTSGQSLGVGTGSSDGISGKTTAEMQMESTFLDAGWDFVDETANGTEDIWSICEGTNYPRLVWQIPAGDFVCPDGITIEDFLFFIEHWRDDNCDLSNDYCQGTDLDFSGTVDANDLEIFFENWLAGGNN